MLNNHHKSNKKSMINGAKLYCAIMFSVLHVGIAEAASFADLQWYGTIDDSINHLSSRGYSVSQSDRLVCRVFKQDCNISFESPNVRIGTLRFENERLIGVNVVSKFQTMHLVLEKLKEKYGPGKKVLTVGARVDEFKWQFSDGSVIHSGQNGVLYYAKDPSLDEIKLENKKDY